MKTCSCCHKQKDKQDYSNNATRKDGLQDFCKECAKVKQALYYRDNSEYYKRKSREKKKNISEIIKKIKSETPCFDCGQKYPYYVMDFDHISDKKIEISKISNKGSLSLFKTELDKCQIVCSNCHRIRTYNRKTKPVE